MFFRGWWIRTTRIFGVGAIFGMAVPYSMIHYGKPYLETCSAVIAGVVLGSLGFGIEADMLTLVLMGLVTALTLLSVAAYVAEWVRHMNSALAEP